VFQSRYYGYGISLITGGFINDYITPILAIVILMGAVLSSLEEGKKIMIGSIIVIVTSIFLHLSLFHVFIVGTLRFLPFIMEWHDIGVSGLIDFLGGFIPSTITTLGIILCIAGGTLRLKFLSSKKEVVETKETKTCPKCGAINNAHHEYCFKCGAKLEPVPSHPKSEGLKETETLKQVSCPVCGKQLPDGYRFCSRCGTPLPRVEQPPPPPPPDVESRITMVEEKIRELEELLKSEQSKSDKKREEESEDRESIFKE
jgi:DNA-directed RNA polymerase subunit RPC12/RpoP